MTKPAKSALKSTVVKTAVGEGPAEIVGRGIVFESQAQTARGSLAFPGICVLRSGRWLASCRAAPTKIKTRGQHVLLSHSDDEGHTWSTPVAPFEPPTIDGKPGLFRSAYLTSLGYNDVLAALLWVDHSNPEADFFNEATQGLLDTRILFARSQDGGHTWSAPHLMDTSPFHVPTPLTGPVLVGKNGEWICQFELNKHYNDWTEWRHASVLMISTDEGASWPEHSIASGDGDNRIFYWDQRPCVTPDGGILDLFWTYDNTQAKYLPIHARQSIDTGDAWSALWNTEVPGQPAPAVFLENGNIAMVYVDREAEPILKMRVSVDEGATFPQSGEMVLYQLGTRSQIRSKHSMQDAWAEMGCYSLGLPTTTLLPDGDVLVVFYAGPTSDQTDVRWIRLRFDHT